MVVFELRSKTVVVELQMTTKLNFWRFLPPETHGNTLAYMLITPAGGFHWMPLDVSPRPRQVWKRGPTLQGKKIISYEEGGSNGESGTLIRSTMALLLTSTSTTEAPVEAWCLPVTGGTNGLLMEDDILSGTLVLPRDVDGGDSSEFLPYVVEAISIENNHEIVLEVTSIGMDSSSGALVKGDVVARSIIADAYADRHVLEPPMAMGNAPEVYCCSHKHHIILAIRKKGIVLAYTLKEEGIKRIGETDTGRYIVAMGVRAAQDEGCTEVVLLLCDETTTKDGSIAKIAVFG